VVWCEDTRSVRSMVEELVVAEQLSSGRSSTTMTKDGWCLVEGLVHVASAHGGKLVPVIERHGLPKFYFESSNTVPPCRHASASAANRTSIKRDRDTFTEEDCVTFRALCWIIVGQQLAGPLAIAIWKRLLAVVDATPNQPNKLTPRAILMLGEGDVETTLRKPAGLSNAKCRSVLDLAQHYQRGDLSDSLLFSGKEKQVREALLRVKGLGPWSVDMFLLFHVQSPNVLPLGDLAFRKGTVILFDCKGKGKNGSLCEKKDASLLQKLHQPFSPYQSLSSFYMWRCNDTVAFNDSDLIQNKSEKISKQGNVKTTPSPKRASSQT
jgi:DNA-3-methyladenine glycosylase II